MGMLPGDGCNMGMLPGDGCNMGMLPGDGCNMGMSLLLGWHHDLTQHFCGVLASSVYTYLHVSLLSYA
jgi:hypothetical protein